MVRLEELQRVIGGTVHADGGWRWLETDVGRMRARVVHRHTAGGIRIDLAVATTRVSFAPFPTHSGQWQLDDEGLEIPRLRHGFAFVGCYEGVLIATCGDDPALDELVAALHELAAWARKPWRPRIADPDELAHWMYHRDTWLRRARAATTFALMFALACVVRWLLR